MYCMIRNSDDDSGNVEDGTADEEEIMTILIGMVVAMSCVRGIVTRWSKR